MIQASHPAAAGIAASHSDALRGRRAKGADLVPELERVGQRLATLLTTELGDFLAGEEAQVRVTGAETMAETALARRIGPVAANCLQAIAGSPHRLLASIEARAVLAQLDRTFGGDGDVGDELPSTLPMSAELLARQFEDKMVAALGKVLSNSCQLRSVSRNSRYAMLSPFPAGCEIAVLTLEVAEGGLKPWQALFAIRLDGLAMLVDRPAPAAAEDPADRPSADPLDAPFADIPLPVEAALVDMNIPLSRLAQLQPGAVIPVAVARSVPLRIGDAVIARGSVGEFDDRIALQITQTLLSGKDKK